MEKIDDPALNHTSNYRWIILGLTALTGFAVMGFPTTALAVLFSEVADDLQLDLVQIGLVWGVGTVMGIFTTILAGSFIDYFGTRRSLVVLAILTGLTGLLRGFAVDFGTLFLFSFLFGMVQPVLPMNLIKLNRQWFAPQQLGLASGIMSAGFATGLMLGSQLGAGVLSPALGGWRGVLIFLGIISIVIGILWFFVHPPLQKSTASRPNVTSIFANLRHVMGYREVWIYGIAVFGVIGLMRGVIGYVPTYLREIGWAETIADTPTSVFFLASLIGVIPISYLSDRLGDRHIVMIIATLALSLGTGMMFFAQDSYAGVMLAMVIGGFFFDSFMAMNGASVTEIEGMDIAVMGSALGFIGMMQSVSATIAPPLGNALSALGLNTPFLLWAACGLLAAATLIVTYRRKKAKRP
ncbi:MAG: MFS transporter [Aggregatilineales bacterium]